MYKKIFLFILVLFFTSFVFAQETEINTESISSEETVQQEDIVSTTEEVIEDINPKTGFPAIKDKPFVVFDYGVAASTVNRVIFQEIYERSNFNYLT